MKTEIDNPAAKSVTTMHHMCVDIEGVLRWSNGKIAKLFTDEGEHKPGSVVRAWLKLQLAQGKRVLPMGECDTFSFQTGCPGHPVEEKPTTP